jgi:type II secretory pathway pseudopilin PulG
MEMLVVVILVGIIGSMAGVKVSSMMTQQRVIRAASTVQTGIELAFAVAQRNRQPIRISWASSASSLLLKVSSRAGDTVYQRTDMKPMGLSNGDVTTSSSYIDVFPNGFASDTFSVKISVVRNGKTYQRRVRMSRAGLVKVL